MSVLILPTCPADCTGALPPVDFDVCAPQLNYGEISHIYVATPEAADFANVELLGEWTTRVSEDSVDADAIRELVVIGELPEPEQAGLQISGDRTVVGQKAFTINFEIDETNDINYNWLLTHECNIASKVWFRTSGGLLYGGNAGIEASIRVQQIIPRERTELIKFVGTVKWKSQFNPLRSIYPMA